jgi:transglutaminase-like putative cysteine protease
MMKRTLAVLIASLALAGTVSAKTPPWVRAAIPAEIPPAKDAEAIVLLDDTNVTVMPDGTLNTRYRRVVKILTTAGRDHGVATAWYDHDTKLRSMHAWSIDASGEYEVKERDAIETTPTDFELYTDARLKVLTIPAANPGSVVAFEVETSDKPYLPQTTWQFQEEIPVVVARYALVLPTGWTYDARWINHKAVEPVGGVWTLNSVPPLPDEPRRPSSSAIAGRIGIQLLAPGAKPLTWNDIARWYNDLSVPRSTATPALQEKTKALIASGDPLRALARFAQRDVRYVAVEIGIGGYQPHAAGDVFTNRFGDCKDKATLLRTMLKEAGVDAYQVLIHTSRGAIDPAYPSLGSFNHVIAAIPVTAEKAKGLHAVIDHPRLGKLLLFDPTSTTTPFGQLPQWLQATRGLLVTTDGGELIELPAHVAEASQLRRKGTLNLDDGGTLSGTIEEVRTGHVASRMRMSMQALNTGERVRMIESSLASHLASYTASDIVIEHLDDPETDLVIRYKIEAPHYAKRVADMMLVRPRVLGQKTETLVDLAKREQMYVTDGPSLHVDEIDIKLPAARRVDELPAKIELTTPAVQYASASTFADGVLQYRRRYALKTFFVPLDALPELNNAWTKILGDERASAVFR